jgi:tetratricopeptide (TPR) repeat protein
MRRLSLVLLSAFAFALPLQAQQICANYNVVVNSPEDKLMLAVNGADNPQEQVTALEAFLQQHADSKFVPCAYQNLTKAYVKLKEYDQAIAAGQKAVAANFLDVRFLESLLQAYIASGNASDAAFAVLYKAPAEIKEESIVAHPQKATEAEWQQMEKQAQAGAASETQFMEYAFFQLLSRVTDPAKRIAGLDEFSQAYPQIVQKEAGLVDYHYAMAYNALNQQAKADEYAEKVVAADPSNVEALNLLAFDYAIAEKTKKFDPASADAEKIIQLAPSMKKPEGMTDNQFKAQQNNLLGNAHFCLGYIHLARASGGKRFATHSQMAPAIRELESAVPLLANNPGLQGGALFYLGTAYEEEYPAEHHEALAALEKAVKIEGPWKALAEQSLAKVRRALR